MVVLGACAGTGLAVVPRPAVHLHRSGGDVVVRTTLGHHAAVLLLGGIERAAVAVVADDAGDEREPEGVPAGTLGVDDDAAGLAEVTGQSVVLAGQDVRRDTVHAERPEAAVLGGVHHRQDRRDVLAQTHLDDLEGLLATAVAGCPVAQVDDVAIARSPLGRSVGCAVHRDPLARAIGVDDLDEQVVVLAVEGADQGVPVAVGLAEVHRARLLVETDEGVRNFLALAQRWHAITPCCVAFFHWMWPLLIVSGYKMTSLKVRFKLFYNIFIKNTILLTAKVCLSIYIQSYVLLMRLVRKILM